MIALESVARRAPEEGTPQESSLYFEERTDAAARRSKRIGGEGDSPFAGRHASTQRTARIKRFGDGKAPSTNAWMLELCAPRP